MLALLIFNLSSVFCVSSLFRFVFEIVGYCLLFKLPIFVYTSQIVQSCWFQWLSIDWMIFFFCLAISTCIKGKNFAPGYCSEEKMGRALTCSQIEFSLNVPESTLLRIWSPISSTCTHCWSLPCQSSFCDRMYSWLFLVLSR